MSRSSYATWGFAQCYRIPVQQLEHGFESVAAKLRVWFKVPAAGDVTLIELGTDGAFVLPGAINVDLGVLKLLDITATSPFRVERLWEMNVRLKRIQYGDARARQRVGFGVTQ
jgi:hypothetical protein